VIERRAPRNWLRSWPSFVLGPTLPPGQRSKELCSNARDESFQVETARCLVGCSVYTCWSSTAPATCHSGARRAARRSQISRVSWPFGCAGRPTHGGLRHRLRRLMAHSAHCRSRTGRTRKSSPRNDGRSGMATQVRAQISASHRPPPTWRELTPLARGGRGGPPHPSAQHSGAFPF
jgi:hypothetical protein